MTMTVLQREVDPALDGCELAHLVYAFMQWFMHLLQILLQPGYLVGGGYA